MTSDWTPPPVVVAPKPAAAAPPPQQPPKRRRRRRTRSGGAEMAKPLDAGPGAAAAAAARLLADAWAGDRDHDGDGTPEALFAKRVAAAANAANGGKPLDANYGDRVAQAANDAAAWALAKYVREDASPASKECCLPACVCLAAALGDDPSRLSALDDAVLDLARDVCLKSACKQHNDVATAALACVAAACTAGPAPGFVERGAGGAVVASLVEACLAPDGSLLTPSAAAVAGEGLKALNAMARTDREAVCEAVFAAQELRPQLLHLCDVLFSCLHVGGPFQRTASDGLDALVELVGHLARHDQECLLWASPSRPALMERLVKLPIRYFSSSSGMNALFPTLAAACVGNDRVSAKAAEDVGLGAVADYVRGASSNKTAAEALRGRLPEAEWAAAAAYLDRVGDAGSLD